MNKKEGPVRVIFSKKEELSSGLTYLQSKYVIKKFGNPTIDYSKLGEITIMKELFKK